MLSAEAENQLSASADSTNRDITKTESHNCFIIHCFKEINDKCISHPSQFIFDEPCFYVNLALLLEIMHCVYNLWIIHLFASKLVTTVYNKNDYYTRGCWI